MHIDYLSASALISDAANSVHVMRMSAALTSLGHTVTLHGYLGFGADDMEVFRYYGAPRTFAIRRHCFAERVSLRVPMALSGLGLPVGPLSRFLQGKLVLRNETARGDGIRGGHHILYARNVEWLLACLRPDSRFIYESHEPPSDARHHFMHRRLFRHSGFLGLVVISQPLRSAYLSAYPHLNGTKVVVAADGADEVDVPAFRDTPHARFQVGYVGHLYPGRGGDLMIKLARALSDADFHLVGGRSEDISRLKSLDPPANIVFHGHRPPACLSDFYRRFDAVLAPYQTKVSVAGGRGNTARWMSPLKIFEYMAHARPIIASDLPVLREVLSPDRTALLVEPNDPAAWIEALRWLMNEPAERRALGERGHAAFLANYTWRRRASRILDSLELAPR